MTFILATLAYLGVGVLVVRLTRARLHDWYQKQFPLSYRDEGVSPGAVAWVVVGWPVALLCNLDLFWPWPWEPGKSEEFTRSNPAPKKQPIPKAILWAVWQRDDFTCQTCGRRDDLTVDHIIAESKGGPTEIGNLQTLCRPCNSRKGAR